jgi:hypothetical protein
MRLAATFLNYVLGCVYIYIYTIKIAQQFRRLGILPIVIFTFATLEPARKNGCGTLAKKLDTPGLNRYAKATEKKKSDR